jgi:YbgC/YbaW family acyl-CoA thioester hydrolase
MENEIASYKLVIKVHHLDTFGHVNNAVYLQMFEEARWDVVGGRGYGLDMIRKTGHGPTILEIHMAFQRELTLGMKIDIRTQLKSYEGKVAVLKQWIVNEAGETCCTTDFKIGLFDLKLRKLILPTPEWLQAIGMSKPLV